MGGRGGCRQRTAADSCHNKLAETSSRLKTTAGSGMTEPYTELGKFQSKDDKSFEINAREAPGRQNFLSFFSKSARRHRASPSRSGRGERAPRSRLGPHVLALESTPGPASPPRQHRRLRAPGETWRRNFALPRGRQPHPGPDHRAAYPWPGEVQRLQPEMLRTTLSLDPALSVLLTRRAACQPPTRGPASPRPPPLRSGLRLAGPILPRGAGTAP